MLTLPEELRSRYRLKEGELFTLLDLDGVFVLSPGVSVVAKRAAEIERLREEAGLAVEDLLVGLDDTRQGLYAETYGTES